MWKAIAMKYFPIAILFVLVVAILCVSRYAETRKNNHQENGSHVNAIATTADHSDKGAKQADESEDSPGWIDTFAWPNGVTAWALLLTLLVVAWQSTETRDAAKSTRDALILQYRPKIVIRSLTLTRNESSNFEIVLVLRNSGSNLAYISESNFAINWITPDRTQEGHVETITAITLKPGETRSLKFTAPEFYIRFEASRIILENNPSQMQTVYLGCIASISYTDGIGTRRDTALNRVYDYRASTFVISNTEADYSD
jgi:hypothetical protein